MTEIFGALLTALNFVAPAVAVWFLVLRKKEGWLSSGLAVAAMSAFLVPTLVFLLNRIFAYPLDRTGLTGLATTVVAGAVIWHWLIAPRTTSLGRLATRLGRLIGGATPNQEEESDPLAGNLGPTLDDAILK